MLFLMVTVMISGLLIMGLLKDMRDTGKERLKMTQEIHKMLVDDHADYEKRLKKLEEKPPAVKQEEKRRRYWHNCLDI